MRANTGTVSKQRGMNVGNGMAGNKQVICEVVGDACSKLLSCDRELQTRARKTETSAGKYPSTQSTGTGVELDFTRRKETSQPQSKHRRHVAIRIESITQIQRQPCATTIYINSDFDTSLVDYRHSLQDTCCLRQTKPAVLAPLHWRSEDKSSEKSHRFWKSRHYIHRLLYSVLWFDRKERWELLDLSTAINPTGTAR